MPLQSAEEEPGQTDLVVLCIIHGAVLKPVHWDCERATIVMRRDKVVHARRDLSSAGPSRAPGQLVASYGVVYWKQATLKRVSSFAVVDLASCNLKWCSATSVRDDSIGSLAYIAGNSSAREYSPWKQYDYTSCITLG